MLCGSGCICSSTAHSHQVGPVPAFYGAIAIGMFIGRWETGHSPGNSVSEMPERMNGGAVSEERSPETDAMLLHAGAGAMAIVSTLPQHRTKHDDNARLQKCCPAALLCCRNGLVSPMRDADPE